MSGYEELKDALKAALQQRDADEAKLAALQQEIYDRETAYFSKPSTATTTSAATGARIQHSGNIVKGFDGFSKTHAETPAQFTDADRIFSLSGGVTER